MNQAADAATAVDNVVDATAAANNNDDDDDDDDDNDSIEEEKEDKEEPVPVTKKKRWRKIMFSRHKAKHKKSKSAPKHLVTV